MLISKIILILVLYVVLLPLQFSFAQEFSWEKIRENLGSITEMVDKIEESLDPAKEILIQNLMNELENLELVPENIIALAPILEEIYKLNPYYFSQFMSSHLNLVEPLSIHYSNKMDKTLSEIQSNEEFAEYKFDRTQDLKEFSDRLLLAEYSDAKKVDEIRVIDQYQGAKVEIVILAAKGIAWPDGKGGILTLEEVAKKEIQKNPYLKDSDLAEDPIRTFIIMAVNSKYLYTQPIISVSDKMITLEEYCITKIDEENCYKLKIAITLAKLVSSGRDPILYQKSAEQFFYLIKEIDEKNNGQYQDEISTAQNISSLSIPDWTKNNALWWVDGKISEDEFVNGLKFLVEKRIIKVN